MPSIAVIVCDTPINDLSQKYGDFGDNCIELLTKSGLIADFTKYYVCSPDKALVDDTISQLDHAIPSTTAVILTGSRSDAFSQLYWINSLNSLLSRIRSKLPIIGICFGHQLIAQNFGLTIGRAPSWELGLTKVNLAKDLFQETLDLFDISDPPFSFSLIQFHQDIVFSVPPGLKNIASSDSCNIQGLIGDKILTFQGHPEFSLSFSQELLLQKYKANIISKEDLDKAEKSLGGVNDGLKVGRVIVNFINRELN